MARSIIITNLTDEEQTWGSKVYQPSEEYNVPVEDWPSLWSDSTLYEDVVTKAQVSDGTKIFSSAIEAWSWIRSAIPSEFTPTVIKNEYQLQPAGIDKFELNPSTLVASITLSNKVGLTYDFSCTLTPEHEDAVCSTNFVKRVCIDYVDGGTLTLKKELPEGTYTLSKHVHIDYTLPTPEEGHSWWFLWGLLFDAENFGKNDWLSLEVVAAEIDYDLKKYDACWVRHLVKLTRADTPDGSPGRLPFQIMLDYDSSVPVTLRMDYYPTISTDTTIEVWYDYMLALKDDE